MDLALPRFEGLGDGPRQVHRPWKMSAVSPASPASPDTSSVADRRRSSSPCLNLDEWSSSDDDRLKLSQTIRDRLSRYVMCLRMFRLWIFLKSVGLGIPDRAC